MKRGAASSGSEHPDPYNYSRLYGEDGLKRKRDGEDEEIALFHVRTPKYRRVSRVSEVRGAENGGVVDADRRRLIDEQWAAWRRKRDQKPAQGLGAKEEPPAPADNRSWLKKVWDNPYGKTAIITAGVGVAGLGMDAAMARSAGLSTTVENFGRNLRDNRFTRGLPTQRYPAGAGAVNFMTRPARTGVAMLGTYFEGSAQRHLANMYRPPPSAFSGQRINILN